MSRVTLNVPNEVSFSTAEQFASLFSRAIHISNLRSIQSSQTSTSPSTFSLSNEASFKNEQYDEQHRALSEELSKMMIFSSDHGSRAVHIIFWHPSIPASGIDAALRVFRSAADLIPESHTEVSTATTSGTTYAGKDVALRALANFLHRELELDAFPHIDQDATTRQDSTSLDEQLEKNKAHNENIRHRALWARIYSTDNGVLPLDYVTHVVYLTIGFLNYAFKTSSDPEDSDVKWVENEFIAGCTMLRGMAGTLKAAITKKGDEEEDYSGRIEVWEKGLQSIIKENSEGRVWLHAHLALENIRQGCRDEASEELFDERVWIY